MKIDWALSEMRNFEGLWFCFFLVQINYYDYKTSYSYKYKLSWTRLCIFFKYIDIREKLKISHCNKWFSIGFHKYWIAYFSGIAIHTFSIGQFKCVTYDVGILPLDSLVTFATFAPDAGYNSCTFFSIKPNVRVLIPPGNESNSQKCNKQTGQVIFKI